MSRALPIVLRAMEQRPSRLGERWEELRGKLPKEIGSRMPRYVGPNWDPARWLAEYAAEPEVAAKVVERWDRMWQETRNEWLGTVGPNQVSQRPEYLPLMRLLTVNPDPEISLTAAYLLTGYRPISGGDSVAVRNAMVAGGSRVSLRLHLSLAWQIGLQPKPSPTLIETLRAWADSTNQTCAIAGALGLAVADPAGFPPEKLVEHIWRRLPRAQGREVLEMTRRPGFERLMLSDWAMGFFAKLLLAPPSRTNAATFENDPPKDSILWSYRRLGTNAARFAPALVSQFPQPNLWRSAAIAFATVAGTDAALVPLIIPALTNSETVGPLLLWLTKLGPQARSAREIVQRLAEDELRFPPASDTVKVVGLDPVLAKRYGLRVPDASTAVRKPKNPGFRLPSEISVAAEDSCPWPLVGLWPGSTRGVDDSGLGGLPEGDRSYLVSLPETDIAELAKRCLLAMDSDPTRQTR